MIPAFADSAAASLPLHVVEPDGLDEFLAASPQAAWLRASGFEAGLGDLRLLPGPDGISGAVAGLGTDKIRRRTRFGIAKAIAALPAGDWHLEGATFRGPGDRSGAGSTARCLSLRPLSPGKPDKAIARLKAPDGVNAAQLAAMATGEFLTRDLINTPAQDMGPAELEQAAARDLAATHGAKIAVITGDDLLAQNLPMIHAVGRASPRAPRLIDLAWGDKGPRLTLVGKGVCFDTGGLNLKPSSGMNLMKKDMGGAATVLGLAQMIMALRLPLRLRVLIPAVENVISGNALKPKDILTSRKGLTVEVNDTDAEGRLVLADALTLACEDGLRGADLDGHADGCCPGGRRPRPRALLHRRRGHGAGARGGREGGLRPGLADALPRCL